MLRLISLNKQKRNGTKKNVKQSYVKQAYKATFWLVNNLKLYFYDSLIFVNNFKADVNTFQL